MSLKTCLEDPDLYNHVMTFSVSVIYMLSRSCSAVTQQCCYDSSGMLLADAKEGRLSIGTPLYQDVSTMVTYYRDTVLPFVYCCKEGIPTGQSPSGCSDFQSLLPTNNGEGDVQSRRMRRFFFILRIRIRIICECVKRV